MSETPSAASPAPAAAPAASPAPQALAETLFPDGGTQPDPAAPSPTPAEGTGTEGAGESKTAEAGADTKSGESAADAAYDIKLPEGFEADDAFMTEAQEVLASSGVSKDKAQPLIDLYVKGMQGLAERADAAFAEQVAAWQTEINGIADFQGPTREKSLQAIGKLFDEYGPDVRALMDNPLYGDNPTLAKFFVSVAKALDEGTQTAPGNPASQPRRGATMGEVLFGGTPEENSIITRRT